MLALVVFLVAGLLVSLLVLQASARAEETLRSRAEVEALQEASARERRVMEEQAAEALLLARADELRVSLLRAVSHDLRTPLASIKASVTSLLQRDVDVERGGRPSSSSAPSTRRATASTTSSATCST